MGIDTEDELSSEGVSVVTVHSQQGDYHAYIQGSFIVRKSNCVIVTVHDIGTSHQSLLSFCSLPCIKEVAQRSLIVHVCLPGQEPQADELDGQYPSMQDLSVGVESLLNLLQLSQVIMMGVGAGANICLRLALAHPDKVLGIIAVQPVISAPGMLEQVKGRAVGADLKSSYGRNSDQFLVQHNFGNFENPSDELLSLINKYKDNLHSNINARNLQFFVDSFMKRNDLCEEFKKNLNCDILILVGENSEYVNQAVKLNQVLSTKASDKVSFLKWKNVGNVLLECPDNVSQAILLFCQGVGMVPAVLGQGGRRRCVTRGLSMSEADVPNISRLSLSE